jgi:hypothetical protein
LLSLRSTPLESFFAFSSIRLLTQAARRHTGPRALWNFRICCSAYAVSRGNHSTSQYAIPTTEPRIRDSLPFLSSEVGGIGSAALPGKARMWRLIQTSLHPNPRNTGARWDPGWRDSFSWVRIPGTCARAITRPCTAYRAILSRAGGASTRPVCRACFKNTKIRIRARL